MKKKFLFMLMVLAFGVVNVAKADFQLIVRTNSPSLPSTTMISVNDWTTVENMKNQLAEQWGVWAIQIRLIYAGKQLEDGRTVVDYNIKKDSILHAVLTTFPSGKESVVEEESFFDQVKAAWNGIFS